MNSASGMGMEDADVGVLLCTCDSGATLLCVHNCPLLSLNKPATPQKWSPKTTSLLFLLYSLCLT
jgi:hypothetical protein